MSLLPTSMAVRSRLGHVWTRLQRYEFTTLLLVLGVPVALLVFAELAEEVGEGDTGTFDRVVLRGLRSSANLADPVGPLWLEKAAIDVTSLGSTTVLALVSIAAIGFLFVVRKRAAALMVFVSVGGGQLLSSLLKEVFERPRPDLVPHVVQIVTTSFPSGHAMLSAVTYLTLGALLARMQPEWRVKGYVLTVAVLLTFLVGVSRVYLGVHWPTDVLAGWCVGAAWAMLCWLVAVWLQRRGQVEADAGNARQQPMHSAPETLSLAARLRRWAKTIKRDVHALYFAAKHPGVPWYAKLAAALVAAYALSPIDLIPDFIPVLGYLDEVVLLPLGIVLVVRLVPTDIMAECRKAADDADRAPVSRTAAIAIVLVWIVALGITGWWGYATWIASP